jgi:acetyl esterase/lipase
MESATNGREGKGCYGKGTFQPKYRCVYSSDVPGQIWIHGGGFTTGNSQSPFYNGARLANDEDVVVVSMKYFSNLCNSVEADRFN